MQFTSRSVRQPTVAGFALGAVLLAAVIWLQIRRGAILGGDQMIWMHVAHWNALGEPFYSGVWEHKDAGLFLIYRFAHDLGGTQALRLLGMTAALISSWAFWRLVREEDSSEGRVANRFLVTLAWSIFAFSSPSFLYTYTENFAFSLFLIGVTFRKKPYIAGILFGLASCVKIGFVIPISFVVTFWVFAEWRARGPSAGSGWGARCGAALRSGGRVALSLAIAVFFVCLMLLERNELEGWLEVIRYNVYYSGVRREGVSFLRSQIVSVHATPAGLAVASVVLIALLDVVRSVLNAPSGPSQRLLSLDAYVWAFLGVAVMSVLQSPLNLHHWYPLTASALAVIAKFQFGELSRRPGESLRGPVGGAKRSFRLGLVLAAGLFVVNLSTLWAQNSEVDPVDDKSVSVALNSIPMNQRTIEVLVIGGNSRYFPLSSDSQSVELECRFLLWFWWVEDYFLDEMEECFGRDVDLVYVMEDRNLGARTREFVGDLPTRGFVSCGSQSGANLFVRGDECG